MYGITDSINTYRQLGLNSNVHTLHTCHTLILSILSYANHRHTLMLVVGAINGKNILPVQGSLQAFRQS